MMFHSTRRRPLPSNALSAARRRALRLTVTCAAAAFSCFLETGLARPAAGVAGLPDGIKRVVMLGDSITYAGDYVSFIEAYFVTRHPGRSIEFINVGLPSETVSGLSEPGHAKDAFLRPGLHERLERVLERTKPDLVLACYGMNDGIYLPFSEERFARFREGMLELRKQVARHGCGVRSDDR